MASQHKKIIMFKLLLRCEVLYFFTDYNNGRSQVHKYFLEYGKADRTGETNVVGRVLKQNKLLVNRFPATVYYSVYCISIVSKLRVKAQTFKHKPEISYFQT